MCMCSLCAAVHVNQAKIFRAILGACSRRAWSVCMVTVRAKKIIIGDQCYIGTLHGGGHCSIMRIPGCSTFIFWREISLQKFWPETQNQLCSTPQHRNACLSL